MAKDKSTDPLERKNISLRRSVITIGEGLVGTMHKSSFSQLLTDLVLDAQKRQASGEDKTREQNLKELLDLLAKVRTLESKVADMKSDRSAMKSVWKRHFKEEAAKKAGTPTV